MTYQGTIDPPSRSAELPIGAQWLGGQGTGGWFHLEGHGSKDQYRIRRYSPQGTLECDRLYYLTDNEHIDLEREFKFTYLSHCQMCTVLQGDSILKFKYYSKK